MHLLLLFLSLIHASATDIDPYAHHIVKKYYRDPSSDLALVETIALQGFLEQFASGTEDASKLASHVEALLAAPGGKSLVQRLGGKKQASP